MSPLSTLQTYLSSLPGNAYISASRLTPYGWLRLALVVAVYLLVRPYLLRLAARGQVRGLDQVVGMRAGGGMERGGGDEGEGGGEGEGGRGSGSGRDEDENVKGTGGVVVRRMVGGEDEDEEFLRRYCDVRRL